MISLLGALGNKEREGLRKVRFGLVVRKGLVVVSTRYGRRSDLQRLRRLGAVIVLVPVRGLRENRFGGGGGFSAPFSRRGLKDRSLSLGALAAAAGRP